MLMITWCLVTLSATSSMQWITPCYIKLEIIMKVRMNRHCSRAKPNAEINHALNS